MANEIVGLLTRGNLADAVASKLQDTGTSRRTMILVDLDMGYRMALQRYVWPQAIRWIDAGISTASGDAYFFLPKEAANLIRVTNATVPAQMQETSISELSDATQGFVNITGIACQYARAGDSGINTTLTAATALEILSDGTDTRTGFIEGFLSGQQKRTAITMNGATPVALGSWDDVVQVYLTNDTTRTATLRKVSGATTVATISPNETSPRYARYRVWPIPSQATVMRCIYRYTPPAILAEAHEYIIPIQDFLIHYAWGKGLEQRREFSPATQILQQAESILVNMYFASRGHRTEQYQPASPYMGWDTNFYTPVLNL